MKLKELTNHLESIAPLAYQESYDNAGLIVGEHNMEVSAALISLDATVEVIDEAIAKGCNLVISHHPIVFGGLKRFNNANYVQKAVQKAIKHDIALYAIHTNLDNVSNGVNAKIANLLGLKNQRVLKPKNNVLAKLEVFVPVANTSELLNALYAAGAGKIGNYSDCSFRMEGKGTFRPNEKANPFVGKKGAYEEVEEHKIEVIFPKYLQQNILQAMYNGHVYEEVAHYISDLNNRNQDLGSGMYGEFEKEIPNDQFLSLLKNTMGAAVIKYTDFVSESVSKVAMCGGSGGFLLNDAIAAGADVFITSDYKYHEFFDANGKIAIADIGHYESEQFTKDLIQDIISEKFPNFASYLSGIKTNPVNYFY